MSKARKGRYNPILPVLPPEELIPRGYTQKLIILWLSFFGVFIGVAGTGGPLAIILPICLAVFLINLTLMMIGKAKERPAWLYKQAQENYHRARYDKALKKLNSIIELRPDMEDTLLPAVLVCKNRTRDSQGAAQCCDRLFKAGKINTDTNPVLIMEMLSVMKNTGDCQLVKEITANFPEMIHMND